ncbi:MAG: tripartite tricarboxylate transporter permease [Clostridia bacterium]|nr:tripartite tricarboxylate transporter permease [Clostridia bacterium]
MSPDILTGIGNVLGNPTALLFIVIGTVVGIIFGAIPGLTATMAIVMFLPLTYAMTATEGISTLVALYIGGISGGLVSAILLNIPGTPSSVATCFDGRPMANKGQAAKALGVGIFFSFLGTIFGIVMLIFISPLLASVAIKFGAYEYCALSIFSLSLVITLTGKDMVKGIISAVVGAMFATVGLSPIDSRERFTFGSIDMQAGFKLLVFLIGLFAITEVVKEAENVRRDKGFTAEENVRLRGLGFTFKEFCSQIVNTIRSALIGLGIGILPGIGGGVSCMLSYTVAKNTSKHPEKFGTGVIDGVVASETANNAGIGGAMIPLLSLGIPGDPATAMLLGGFMVHDIAPGPLIFQKNGSVVYGIFVAMLLASIVMCLFMFGGLRGIVKVLKIPKYYLLPVIVMLCCVGAIGDSNRMFDVWGVLLFGLIGFFFAKAEIPTTPMILGFILGPMFEENLRRASKMAQSDPITNHPISIVFLVITVIAVALSVRSNLKQAKKAKMETLTD